MLWLALFVGLTIHWFLKATASTATANTLAGYGLWTKANIRGLVARTFGTVLFFGLWTLKPDAFNVAATEAASYLTPGVLRTAIEKVGLPLNLFTAAAWGYLADSIGDKLFGRFEFFKAQFPSVNGEGK